MGRIQSLKPREVCLGNSCGLEVVLLTLKEARQADSRNTTSPIKTCASIPTHYGTDLCHFERRIRGNRTEIATSMGFEFRSQECGDALGPNELRRYAVARLCLLGYMGSIRDGLV